VITLFVGAGYTGARVLRRLPDAIALGRSRTGDERLDLDRDERLRIALPEQYAVIYSVPPASEQPGDPRLARFLALLPHPPERIVYLSTTGVYGNRDGERVDEKTEPRPESARAERRLAAERLLAEWCTGRSTTAVVLRVPGIYGPGRLGTQGLRDAMPVLREEDANPGNRIHVDVIVPHDVAEQRVAEALAAGGTLLTDEYARSWWVLADADGNEACVSTWQDR